MKLKENKKGVCADGFKAAGIKEGKYGVALIAAEESCSSAGVFTKNSCMAAPVVLTKKKVKNGLQAVIANSGCANACVKEGMKDAAEMAVIAGKILKIKPEKIGVASTGIIGKRIDLNKVKELALTASKKLSSKPEASLNAAKAIMTTDTTPKQVSAELNGIQVGGICKGAGMIAPDMATMLCFITTNANLTDNQLQKALKTSVDKSFNMAVIDGDMSTNDTVILLASRKRKCSIKTFQTLLDHVTTGLAKKIAKDGEGASKYMEIEVVNAKDDKTAAKAARAVASSPLVKTAFYGENPNWGRIASTIGSKMKIKPMEMSITFSSQKGKEILFDKGKTGNAAKARKILKAKEIKVTVNLRLGKGKATAYTCDLTEEYTRINAGYS